MAPLPYVEAPAAGGLARAEVLPWTQDAPQPGQLVYSLSYQDVLSYPFLSSKGGDVFSFLHLDGV